MKMGKFLSSQEKYVKNSSVLVIVLLSIALVGILTDNYGADVGFYLAQIIPGGGNSRYERLENLTTQLLRQSGDYEKIKKSGKSTSTITQSLTETAIERRKMMLTLILNDPELALRQAIPAGLASKLPAEIRGLLEENVSLSGELQVLHIDNFQTQQAHFEYFLLTNNKRYKLYFGDNPPSEITGNSFSVSGVALGEEVAAARNRDGGGSSTGGTTTTAALSGPQKTLAILMNFSDNTSQPFTTSQIQQKLFSSSPPSANSFYAENSHDSTSFEGTVAGWFTINSSAGTCDYMGWASAADSAAQGSGINLSQYSRKVYVFPTSGACNWSGLGTVGGNPSRAWINGYTQEFVFIHELGHNLGMHHAATFSCGSKQIDVNANCSHNEYGDPYDSLGGSWNIKHMNSAHKQQMSWINVQSVTSNGTYTVYAHETPVGTPQSLKIFKPDTNDYYYVEYRQAFGYDADLPTVMINGISIHTLGASSARTRRLDMTPDGNFGSSALSDGASFNDPANGITVTQLSHNTNSATLQVALGSGTCNQSAPTVSLSPASQNGTAGQNLAYTIQVTNKDGTACGNSVFNLGQTLPSQWVGSFSVPSLTINPGQTGSTTMFVQSASGSANGSYTVTANVSSSGTSAHNGSASSTYMVYTPVVDTTPPNINITSPTNGANISGTKRVTISSSATDDNAVTLMEIRLDNKLIKSCTGSTASLSCSINVTNNKNLASGTHTVNVRAYDGNSNMGEKSSTFVK